MTLTTAPAFHPLTAGQAAALNALHRAASELLSASKALEARAAEITSSVLTGYRLTGFESDVLGQAARKVQHQASVRDTMSLACEFVDAPRAATLAALVPGGSIVTRRLYFSEGATTLPAVR